MNKFVMREAMKGLVPEQVLRRQDKMGFATPQDSSLCNVWRPELEALFSSPACAQREYWDASRLQHSYRQYCTGDLDIGTSMWRCMTLELWHQQWHV